MSRSRHSATMTSTSTGLGADSPSNTIRFLTPRVIMPLPFWEGNEHAMGIEGNSHTAHPSDPSQASPSSASIATWTHATAATEMDAMYLRRMPSFDAATNTASMGYLHPHADIFAEANHGATDHFMTVFGPPAKVTATAASVPLSPASSRATSLQTTLLSMHANKLLSSLQPTYVSSLAREQVFRHIQSLVYHLDPTLHMFSYGSVPLKTYLPEGDIDIGIVLSGRFGSHGGHGSSSTNTAAQNFLLKLKNIIEQEAAREKEEEQQSPYTLTHLTFVNAPEVKVLKLQYNNSLLIDISVNTTSALATVCWIEEMEREMVRALGIKHAMEREQPLEVLAQFHPFDLLLAGRPHNFHSHILKKSILLIKAWSTYESRTLASAHALLSTYALEVLVIYVMQYFPGLCISPIHVLYIFLHFYSHHWNWEKHALSLGGPIDVEALERNQAAQSSPSASAGSGGMWDRYAGWSNGYTASSPAPSDPASPDVSPEEQLNSEYNMHQQPTTLLDLDLLSKLCAKYTRKSNSSVIDRSHSTAGQNIHDPYSSMHNPLADEIDALVDARYLSVSTSTSIAASTGTPLPMWSALTIPKTFLLKHCNIVDPLDPANNLGKSVNFASFSRIKQCWAQGAKQLRKVFELAREVGECIHATELGGEKGDSHILQLLESLHEPSTSRNQPTNTTSNHTTNTTASSTTNVIQPAGASNTSTKNTSAATSSSITAFPSGTTTTATVSHHKSDSIAASAAMRLAVTRFRSAFNNFFQCTAKRLAKPHRPDLTGLHADDSMHVITSEQSVEGGKGNNHTGSEEKNHDHGTDDTATGTNTNSKEHHQKDGSAHKKDRRRSSVHRQGHGGVNHVSSAAKESIPLDSSDDERDSNSTSDSDSISPLDSNTSSPVIHAVLNLGPGAIDRLARASSSFPSSAFTPSQVLGGEMHLGGMLSTVMPSGSVSQPSSLPSSPPSTPPPRSSLPGSPSHSGLQAPFPTPLPSRPIFALGGSHFSPGFGPTNGRANFRSPFQSASTLSRPQHFGTPVTQRSLLTHSPNTKGFMLSPGVHGLDGSNQVATYGSGIGGMSLLPPAAANAMTGERPLLTSFADHTTSHSSYVPSAIPFILPNASIDAADDSATDSDAMASSRYTQAQSFPDGRNSANRRPFILSQLQEASASHRSDPNANSTSVSVTDSPLIGAASTSSSSVLPANTTPPLHHKRLNFIPHHQQHVKLPATADTAAVQQHHTHSLEEVKEPDSVNHESVSAPPIVQAKLDANAVPFHAGMEDELASHIAIGQDHSLIPLDEQMASTADEGVVDPLYNDLTDLQHQYNLLRYLVTSFHGSGSHTHTHRAGGQGYHPRDRERDQFHAASASPKIEGQRTNDKERATGPQSNSNDRDRDNRPSTARSDRSDASSTRPSNDDSSSQSRAPKEKAEKQLPSKQERRAKNATTTAATNAVGVPAEKPPKKAWSKKEGAVDAPSNPPPQCTRKGGAGAPNTSQTPPPTGSSQPPSPQLSLNASRSASPPMHSQPMPFPFIHITVPGMKQSKGAAQQQPPAPGKGKQKNPVTTSVTSATAPPSSSSAKSMDNSDADDESTPLQSPISGIAGMGPGTYSMNPSMHGHFAQPLPGAALMYPPGAAPGAGLPPKPYPPQSSFPPGMMPGPYGPYPIPAVPSGMHPMQSARMYPGPYPMQSQGPPLMDHPNPFHHSLLQAPSVVNRGPPQSGYPAPKGSNGGRPLLPPQPNFAPGQPQPPTFPLPPHTGVPSPEMYTAMQPIVVGAPGTYIPLPMHQMHPHGIHPGLLPPPSIIPTPPPAKSWSQTLTSTFGEAKPPSSGEGIRSTATAAKKTPSPSPNRPSSSTGPSPNPSPAQSGGGKRAQSSKPPRDLFGAKGVASTPSAASTTSSSSSSSAAASKSNEDDDGWETVTTDNKKKQRAAAAAQAQAHAHAQSHSSVSHTNSGSNSRSSSDRHGPSNSHQSKRDSPASSSVAHATSTSSPSSVPSTTNARNGNWRSGENVTPTSLLPMPSATTKTTEPAAPGASMWRGATKIKQALTSGANGAATSANSSSTTSPVTMPRSN